MSDQATDISITDLQHRIQKINRIRRATNNLQKSQMGPRAMYAFCGALLVLGVFFIGFMASVLLDYPIRVSFSFWMTALPALTFAGVMFFSKRPLTWQGWIDTELADYAPLNTAAFHNLQLAIQRDGWDATILQEWVRIESQALTVENNLRKGPGSSRFLNRTL